MKEVKLNLIAGTPLELLKLQRKDEIYLNVNVKNLKDWVISSEALNRGTFNDYPSGVELK